jgi:hypothetical protein
MAWRSRPKSRLLPAAAELTELMSTGRAGARLDDIGPARTRDGPAQNGRRLVFPINKSCREAANLEMGLCIVEFSS